MRTVLASCFYQLHRMSWNTQGNGVTDTPADTRDVYTSQCHFLALPLSHCYLSAFLDTGGAYPAREPKTVLGELWQPIVDRSPDLLPAAVQKVATYQEQSIKRSAIGTVSDRGLTTIEYGRTFDTREQEKPDE